MRHELIRLSLVALARLHAERFLPGAPDAAGMVVTLHHVTPHRLAGFLPNAHLSVTPEFLDRFIIHARGQGWRFVPVDEIVDTPAENPKRIAVTLDDGFRDNLEHAWPVFRRHSVPFTVYVCPGFCDRTAELWWEALERIIAGTEAVTSPGEGETELPTRSGPEKRRAYRLWLKWLTQSADEDRQRAVIRDLADRYGLDLAVLARELVMDWDEVRRIAADPLCAIGAHTMTHPALARLPAERARNEMLMSAERIALEIGSRPRTIAFPYGYKAAAGWREAALAAEAGFAASFTTRPGYIPRPGTRHGLPRVSLNGLYQDPALVSVLLTPGLWRLKEKLTGIANAQRDRAAPSS